MKDLSPRFSKGIEALKALSGNPRYQAAFIFGSVAEGTSTEKSDLDVKVIVDEDNPCENINHPSFDDYKLDITFRSYSQIEQFTEDEIKKGEREPNLVRGVILFDKTGKLTALQEKVRSTKLQKYTPKDYQFVQFMLYHANNKVERVLEDDPISSLYSMHANIGEVLKIHFKLNGKWWVSSKNVLKHLDEWDGELAELVRKFVSSSEPKEKFGYWSAIIDHVTAQMGGRQPIAENNCDCEVCKIDLAALEAK
jgi:predicted nucleotidyltransferase